MNKTAEAKRLMEQGDIKGSLAILKTFRRMDKKAIKSITDAYESIVHCSFYENMRGAEWVEQKISEGVKAAKEYLNV